MASKKKARPLSEMLRDLLKACTVEELARNIGVSTRMIYAYRSGKSVPPAARRDQIAELWRACFDKAEIMKHVTKLDPPAPDGIEIKPCGYDCGYARKPAPADRPSDDPAVSHPSHYTRSGLELAPEIECIDIVRNLPYTLGAAVKYIWRAGLKGTKETALQDIEKAKWHIIDWHIRCVPARSEAQQLAQALVGRCRATTELAALKLAVLGQLLSGLDATGELNNLKGYLRNLPEDLAESK